MIRRHAKHAEQTSVRYNNPAIVSRSSALHSIYYSNRLLEHIMNLSRSDPQCPHLTRSQTHHIHLASELGGRASHIQLSETSPVFTQNTLPRAQFQFQNGAGLGVTCPHSPDACQRSLFPSVRGLVSIVPEAAALPKAPLLLHLLLSSSSPWLGLQRELLRLLLNTGAHV